MNCPFCGGDISPEAAKCKHCGEWVKAKSREQYSHQRLMATKIGARQGVGIVLAIVGVSVAVVMFSETQFAQSIGTAIQDFFRAPIGFK